MRPTRIREKEMKRSYLLVLVITLLSFNVSALNNENQINSETKEYNSQQKNKKYVNYSFKDADGNSFKVQVGDYFDHPDHPNNKFWRMNCKIYRNNKLVAYGQTYDTGSNLIENHITIKQSSVTIKFPVSADVFRVGDVLWFGIDGYLYNRQEALYDERGYSRLKYNKN